MYYINTVPSSVLAPQPCQQMINIMQLLSPNTKDSKPLQSLSAAMEEEVKSDYYFSLKSIGTKQ